MLSDALKQRYPDIQFSPNREQGSVTLIDDGAGARIAYWGRPEPKPNEADILAAFDRAAWLRKTKIEAVYSICQQRLDALSAGYAQSEIATWPAMRAEIVRYNADGSVGPTMQAVIDLGRHTAQTLAAALTPRIGYQTACLANREAHVLALLAYKLVDQIDAHDINAGWPAPPQ